MSRLTGIDFAKYDLDQPLPSDLTTNGHQSALAKWIGKTPRSILQSYARKGGVDFTGTADHVAGMMQDIMEEVGGDGFLIFNSYFDRRYVIEVCDGLVPELQRRGADAQGVRAQAPEGQSAGVLMERGPGGPRSGHSIFTPASWTIFFHLTFSSAM